MTRKTYTGFIENLNNNQIFVFGSNTQGRHGSGTAKIALNNYGAIYGQGHGLQGNSYGLVTKNLKKGYYDKITNKTYHKTGIRSINKDDIQINIKNLYEFADLNKNKEFFIAYTANGTNLNGYSSVEMANMFNSFDNIPINIIFEDKFLDLINFYNDKSLKIHDDP